MENKLIEVTENELSKVEDNALNTKQLGFLLSKTPKQHIYERPGKGGGKWRFVTGVYIKKVLNLMFGWDWSFEVVEHKIDLQLKQAYVLGKLTVNSNGRSIVKMQFGRVDIKFRTEKVLDGKGEVVMIPNPYDASKMKPKTKPTNQPLDVGNDLKAATTDALKKCAAELGIASDVYAPNEFKEIKIVDEKEPLTDDDKYNELENLFINGNYDIKEEDRMHLELIIDDKDVKRYDKAINLLKNSLKNE
jgi:recombination DNA repair RAD52 pathway protein